jgi:excisionase family DNA binding protein
VNALEDRLLYRVTEVAVFLNVSRSKVYELIASGDLPSVKIDRTRLIRGSDLRDYVETLRPVAWVAAFPGLASALDHLLRLRWTCDPRQGVEVLLIGVGQRVQILLSGLDLCVSHPVHHTLEVSAAREKPRSMSMAKIVHPDAEVDARCFDSRQPDSSAERVPRDRSADLSAEQEFVATNPMDPDVLRDLFKPTWPHTEGTWLIVLR